MADLKPCPFCGALLDYAAPVTYFHPIGKCILSGRNFKKGVIGQWNTRTPAPEAVDVRAAAKETDMTAPERIWARPHQGVLDSGDWNAADGVIDGGEYLRADLVHAQIEHDKIFHAQAFSAGIDSAMNSPEVLALVTAARGILHAHRHGNGLQAWYDLADKLDAAIAPFDEVKA